MARESAVQKEIRQKRPFRSVQTEALVALLRTAETVKRRVSGLMEASDLTFQQFNVLRILRGAGDQGLPTLEIAERMIEQAPGITRLLDRLEAKGLVRRERCPRDRRQVLCWATPAALQLLARLDAPLQAADDASLSALTPEELERLIELLDRIRSTPL